MTLRKLTNQAEISLSKRYMEGETIKSLAICHHIHKATVVSILDRQGIQRRHRIKCNSKGNTVPKLSPEELAKRCKIERYRTLLKKTHGKKRFLREMEDDD